MTTATITLTEFLLARIADDEAAAVAYRDGDHQGNPYAGDGDGSDLHYQDRFTPARVLAECEAKRRIVERCAQSASYLLDDDPDDPIEWSAEVHLAADALRALASVYADHPDYRDEWRL